MAIKNVKVYKVGDKLTPKQQRWIDEYIKCDDYTTASRNAGYSGNDTTLKNMGYQNSIKFKEILDARRLELSETINNKKMLLSLRIYLNFGLKYLKTRTLKCMTVSKQVSF